MSLLSKEGYIDMVKIRVRTHCPASSEEKEFRSLVEAIVWLKEIQRERDE